MYDGLISERSSDLESILGKTMKFKDNLIVSMSSDYN
jgi:hypothetical protein